MYKCDKCGKLESRTAVDIGFDLEDVGATCGCGGEWKKVDPGTCPVCGSDLDVVQCVDDPSMERYLCPNYPHCPTNGVRRMG